MLLVLTNGLAAAIPWLMKVVFENFERGEAALKPILGMVVAAGAMAVIRTGSRICILGASRYVAADLRETVFSHLQSLSRSFYDQAESGDLLSRVTGDVQLMRGLTGFGAMNLLNAAIALLIATTMMWRIDPSLTLLAFAPFIFVVGAARYLSRRVFRRTFAAQKALAAMVAYVTERFTGFSVVRTYGREDATRAGFEARNRLYFDATLALVRARAGMVPLFSLVGGIGTVAILWFGGERVASGQLSLGDFVAASGYLAMAAWPSVMVGGIINLVQRANAAAQRLVEVLSTESAARPHVSGVLENPGGAGIGIEVRDLSFAYPVGGTRKLVLERVSFHVDPGEVLGITGPVGAGKTTLISLLLQLYLPPRGSIFFGGVDLCDISTASLRQRVAAVPQHAFLFDRTLRSNVSFGLDRPLSNAELRRIGAISGLARIAEEMPAGFETVAGERGSALSGGQRQRVALARALATDPDLLILDDPFAAVDAATEDEVLASLRAHVGGRTVILVSHRSTSLALADRILVLDGGRVAEIGTHAELLRNGGVYARLHARTVEERALEDAS